MRAVCPDVRSSIPRPVKARPGRCTCIMKLASQSCAYPFSSPDLRERRITSRQAMGFLRTTLILGAVSCALTPSVRAQATLEAPPPHLAVAEGTVTIDREDLSEPAAEGAPLIP